VSSRKKGFAEHCQTDNGVDHEVYFVPVLLAREANVLGYQTTALASRQEMIPASVTKTFLIA
jgi:hypothetical protein